MQVRTRSTLLALGISAVTIAVLTGSTFATAAFMDRDLRFLDPYRDPSIDEAMVLCPMEYAVGCDKSNDVIFLGGSSCRCGIDPGQLPLSGYNLGSHADLQPRAILMTLRGYLAHHPAPKVVALCMSPISFDFRDDDEWAVGMTERFVAAYGMPLGERVSRLDTVERLVRRGFGELVTRGKPDLRSIHLRGQESETLLSYRAKVASGHGFFPIGNGHNPDCTLPSIGLDFVISPQWSRLIADIDHECAARSCRALVFFTPIAHELASRRDMSAADRWLQEITADNPRVVVRGNAIWSMGDDLMFDAVHLNARGVARFMPIVAKDVQVVLAK
jgi:hypothetical protein